MIELHNEFIKQQLPLKYSILEVEKMLVNNYRAMEISRDNVNDLEHDSQVDFKNIVKCYKIDDSEILNHIYNDIEKSIHMDFIQSHTHEILNTEWSLIQSGKLLRVILISEDKKTLTNFTLQGICMELLIELTIMKGLSTSDCNLNNNYYTKYLQLLHSRGHLKLPDL